MKCLYHTDFDGECAGAIVKRRYGLNDKDLIPYNYNLSFPFDKIEKDEEVILVDLAFNKPETLLRLLKITGNVTWLDHHKSSLEQIQLMPKLKRLAGKRDSSEAGCILTWKHFFPKLVIPEAVKFIGDWDAWKFEFGEATRDFHAGLEIEDTNPNSDIWNVLLDVCRMGWIFDNGKICRRFWSMFAKRYLKSWSYEVEFKGYKCLVANIAQVGSTFFGDKAFEKYDILLATIFDGKQWTVSLYSEKVDVSEIAVKYGGGGHRGAAGYQCLELPFKGGINVLS